MVGNLSRSKVTRVAEPRKVSYVRMDEGTVEDYALQAALAAPFPAATPERLLAFMESLHFTFPGGQIDRYAHSLRTATRAGDAGECEEIVVASLLHDIGVSFARSPTGVSDAASSEACLNSPKPSTTSSNVL